MIGAGTPFSLAHAPMLSCVSKALAFWTDEDVVVIWKSTTTDASELDSRRDRRLAAATFNISTLEGCTRATSANPCTYIVRCASNTDKLTFVDIDP